MPQGIKLSNQLYPATGDNILSLAEYINDSRWEGQLKDLLSINASLKGSIDDIPKAINNAITLNNIVINTNIDNAIKQKIVAGTGIFKDNRDNANTEEFQDTLIGIDNTIYGYLDNPLKDPDDPSSRERMYPGCITGIIRGDIDGDGIVNISDVTAMIDRLLTVDAPIESSVELILTLNDSDLFNFDYDIQSNELPYNILSPLSLIERFLKTLKLFKFVINGITTEPLTSTSSDHPLLNVSNNNTTLENHIIICNSYNSNKNSTNSSTRDLQYHYSIKLTHYYFEGNYIEFPKPAHTDILTGTISVIPGDIPENNLISAAVRTSYENGDYLVEGAFNDPEVIIHDPNNVLLYPTQGMETNGISITDVTALIDYLLNGSWTDESYYLYFSSDSFYLIDENNNRINTCPGIIYLGIGTDLKVHYFISRDYKKDKDSNNSRLYPLKWNTSTLDTQDLLEWLNSTVFVDTSNPLSSKLITHIKKRIYLYFNKLNDSDVYTALYDAYYNEDETLLDELFIAPNTKIIQAPTSNLIIKVPLYLYNLTNPLFDTNNLTIIWDITKDTTVSVSIDESYPISIVDHQGNSVNTMEFSNLNLDNPYIVIPIKFNNSDLSKYTYVENGLYYTLKEDVPLTILVDYNVPREDLKLNCQFTNI